MSICENIARLRKEKGWTQAELGEMLGVSNQAVSKWESGMSMPDIMLLPHIADTFDCYIDELFSREVKEKIHYDLCEEFPWNDDDVLRGVVCIGKKILQVSDDPVENITFVIEGDVKSVESACNISISGSVVNGGCHAGKDINVQSSINGGCHAGNDIMVQGSIFGGCNCENGITVGGNITGGCECGNDIIIDGNLMGGVTCDELTVNGNVEANNIEGDVVCKILKCDKVNGDVTILNE